MVHPLLLRRVKCSRRIPVPFSLSLVGPAVEPHPLRWLASFGPPSIHSPSMCCCSLSPAGTHHPLKVKYPAISQQLQRQQGYYSSPPVVSDTFVRRSAHLFFIISVQCHFYYFSSVQVSEIPLSNRTKRVRRHFGPCRKWNFTDLN